MNETSRLKQEQQTEQRQVQSEQTQERAVEFKTVDDLLRHDSEGNPVPPEVGDRLNQSISAEARPNLPWYKKLFG